MASRRVRNLFYSELGKLVKADPNGALTIEMLENEYVNSGITADLDYIWPSDAEPLFVSKRKVQKVARAYFCAWNKGDVIGHARGYRDGFGDKGPA